MPKKIDLKFYEGYRSDVQFFYKGEMLNAIPWKKYCYPVPLYGLNGNFPTLTNITNTNFRVSYKIQNNNFIGDTGEPLEALFIATTSISVGGGQSLDITMRVAHKGLTPETDYGYRNFTFQADGDAPLVGNFQGLTAFAFDDNYADRYYVGFIGAVASYVYSNAAPALPTEDTYVSVDIKIIDLAYNGATGDIYLIDDTDLYQMSFPAPTLTQITTLPTNLSNFTSLVIDTSGTAYISALKGEENVILVYETISGISAVYDSPFSSPTTAFKINYARSAQGVGFFARPITLYSLGEGLATSGNFNTVFGPVWTIIDLTVNSFLKSNVINDVSQQIGNGGGHYFLMATEGGVSVMIYQSSSGAYIFIDSSIIANDITHTVTIGNITTGATDDQISYVGGSTTAAGKNEIFFQEFNVNRVIPVNITALLFSGSVFLPTAVSKVWQMPGATPPNLDSYWIGGYIGKGIRSGQYFNSAHTSIDISVISENYDFELLDIIKADKFIYYFLFNEVGSSSIDANTAIGSYNAETNTFKTGAPGYFLPSDRLWLGGDTFLFRNSENKNSFYYKNSNNLSIDTIDANILNSEGLEGLISTTYAGELVDIITTVDQFYLLGSRGIEIWQNVGAAGLPFRKENYLSIPYHLLPLSDEDTYFIPISRWTYYKGSYVFIGLSNEANVFNLIQIKDGQYKKMELDQTLFYTMLLDENPISDISLHAVNWWGKNYLLLGILPSSTLGNTANYFLISEDNRWAKLSPDPGQIQHRWLLTTSMNSIYTEYDETNDTFSVYDSPNLPVPTGVPLTEPFVVDSIKIEDESEFIILKRILIHIDFPIFDLSLWPVDATYTVSISEDGGRSFSIIDGPRTLTTAKRQVECSYTKSVLEAIIRFECNYPIIVVGGVASYDKGGIV